jgi:hypothetical protein
MPAASCSPRVNAFACGIDQFGTELTGKLAGDFDGYPDRILRGLRRVGRDAGRKCVHDLAAIDGDADAAEDRDPQCPAKLGAGPRDTRRRPCPLGRGGPDDQVGGQGEHGVAPSENATDPTTTSARPEADIGLLP